MSSMVPAGSSLPLRPAELREPWRPTDFRLRVRLRSSKKLGWPALPFGEVAGGGESGGGSGVVLLRRTSVGGGVFFRELFPHELLTRETGGGGGAWGWGFTTATLGVPPIWLSLPGGGGGGKSSDAGGGGGKYAHSGGGEGKSPPDCFAWLTLAWRAVGRLAKLSLPGFGGAGGPFEESRERDSAVEAGYGGEWLVFWGANLLSRFLLDSS